jgi:hypothetical protein
MNDASTNPETAKKFQQSSFSQEQLILAVLAETKARQFTSYTKKSVKKKKDEICSKNRRYKNLYTTTLKQNQIVPIWLTPDFTMKEWQTFKT